VAAEVAVPISSREARCVVRSSWLPTSRRVPFLRLEGEWPLTWLGAEAFKIEFALRYELENPVIAALARPVFAQMADTQVDASIRRTQQACRGSTATYPEASI
jgi:ribosome-associated toxin RatA of RatAB toxin-antitoxin module